MKVLILSNPTSGNANQALVEQVQEELKAGGAEVELYLTLAANDATAYLENYSGPLDVVAVAGGDGTINEAINGLKDKDSSSFRLALIPRSEEHTSELQSRPHLVCRLLLEKKKKNKKHMLTHNNT